MPEFRLLNRKELEEFIYSDEFNNLGIMPITRHRAVSQIINPRADESDILLILAFENSQLTGYLGIMPDLLFPAGNESIKCGWLSAFWVHPSARGKGIGEFLIRKSLEVWNNKILSADYVPATKRIYDKIRAFGSPVVKTGIRLYIRMDLHTILPPKNSIFQKSKGVLKAFDLVFNAFSDVRFRCYKNKKYQPAFEYCNDIDEEANQFISASNQDELFRRGMRELNWIIGYPWVLSVASEGDSGQQYYFSSVAHSFNYYNIKLRDQRGQLTAFVSLCKRDHTLKLICCYARDETVPDIVKVIEFHIVKWKINTFSVFNSGLVRYLTSNRNIGLLKKKIRRHYLISNQLTPSLRKKGFVVQDGDGDLAFT